MDFFRLWKGIGLHEIEEFKIHDVQNGVRVEMDKVDGWMHVSFLSLC